MISTSKVEKHQNKHYEAVTEIVADYMKKISDITGRHYAPFTYYRDVQKQKELLLLWVL